MRVPITYIASSGNKYSLISNGIFHKKANYRKWKYNAKGTKLKQGFRISDFSKDAETYDAELIVTGNPVQRTNLLNNLHDDFENDIRKKKAGKIIWGDSYINCYITESETGATEDVMETSNKVAIFVPYPYWIEEDVVSMTPSAAVVSSYLDYPFDYTYDYTAPVIGEKIVKSSFPFESEFEMIIYGFVDNPRITINGYEYVLYTTIANGAYVIIDSRAQTVMQYNADGTRTNVFNFRNKTASIFEKIPSGNLTITWDATFGVDLKIYRERSEPRAEVTT